MGTRSLKEAERTKRELEEQLAREEMLRMRGHGMATLGDLVDKYRHHAMVYYRKNGQPTSHPHIIETVLNSFSNDQKEMLAQDFGPLVFQAFRNKWIAGDLSRKTCNTYACVAKMMFKWAVTQEMVPVTVYQALCAVGQLQQG